MPRAKRSPEATDAMRRQLVDAARATIETHGLSALTARGLAQQLGWAVGTIYTVAPSLDAIALEANALELAALRDALIARKSELGAATPRETIRALAEVYLQFTQARPKSWGAIFERGADSDADGEPPEWYLDRQNELFALLEAEIAPMAGSEIAARRAARTLWAALQGLLALAMAGHVGDAEKGEHAETLGLYLVDTFLDGLQAQTERSG